MRHWSIKKIVLVLGVVALIVYFLFQARFLILGPEVKITYPVNGSSVEETSITVGGSSRNVAWISLNGRQIYTDENGLWQEKLLVGTGTSIITVRTQDRFGREETDQISVYKK